MITPPPAHWNRKQLRSLGRVSQFAVEAAELALANANLLDENGIILPYLKRRNNGCRLWLFYWLNK